MEKENKSLITKFIQKIILQPLVVTIAAVAIALLGSGGVYYLNKQSETVVSKFRYDFKGASGKQYPDGSIVGPTDILNKSIVEKIKANNSEYAFLNVDDLFFPDSGVVVQEINEENTATYYEIVIPLRHFKGNKTQTIKFIELVNENYSNFVFSKYENLLIKDALISGEDSAGDAYEKSTYFEILTNVDRQNTYINNFVRGIHGDSALTGNRAYELELEKYSQWYSEAVKIITLENEVINNLYVRNFEATRKFAATNKIMLEKEIANNQAIIDALTAKFLELSDGKTNADTNAMMTLIANYVEANVRLEKKLQLYENFDVVIADNINDAFEVELKMIYNKMATYVTSINEKFLQYESQNIKRINVDSSPYTFTKPYRLIIATPLLLIGGFVFAGALLVLIDEIKAVRAQAAQK